MATRISRKKDAPEPKTRPKKAPPKRRSKTPSVETPAPSATEPPSPPCIDWIFEETTKHRRSWDKIAPVLRALAAAHPELIPDGPDKVRPWATGLHEVLFQLHPEFSRKLIREALEAVSRTRRYQEALVAGGPRYDIEGRVRGEVSQEQRDMAATALQQRLSGTGGPACAAPVPPPMVERPTPNAPDGPDLLPERISYRPIGVLSTPWQHEDEMPIHAAVEGIEGVITLDPRLVDGLPYLDGFSHVIALYDFDRVREFRLRVKPPLDDRERGIFATRLPCRPNPIGVSVLELVRIDPPRIHVKNVDMLNGTPVLDIKPYIPEFDSWPASRIGWYSRRAKDAMSVRSDSQLSPENSSGDVGDDEP
ncbi:MAG: tRNA (N6-threonylcarbamoyladenosine(37)-N6)-methyltransferase TrmO [Candidatus Riflebacteria bacterium]|nr:tRNA (N6-threonylcarbamoyladenosine(37)-N6)-methyltransferase TrmO [Candidatus Riflebacteria bacterium]